MVLTFYTNIHRAVTTFVEQFIIIRASGGLSLCITSPRETLIVATPLSGDTTPIIFGWHSGWLFVVTTKYVTVHYAK